MEDSAADVTLKRRQFTNTVPLRHVVLHAMLWRILMVAPCTLECSRCRRLRSPWWRQRRWVRMRNAVVSADGERVDQHSLAYVTPGAAARQRPYLKHEWYPHRARYTAGMVARKNNALMTQACTCTYTRRLPLWNNLQSHKPRLIFSLRILSNGRKSERAKTTRRVFILRSNKLTNYILKRLQIESNLFIQRNFRKSLTNDL